MKNLVRNLRLVAMLGLLSFPMAAQSNSVSVRLYSLHPQQHVQIVARAGNVRWRTCEKCVPSELPRLGVSASGGHIKIEETETNQVFIEGEYRIEPQQAMKISLSAPLRITVQAGLLKLIATLPLEDYVAAALEGESAIFTQPESLKAMAVVVRTYAARFRPRHGEDGFDFCDNTHCQNLNFTGPTPQIRAAMEATRGELLWYQGSPAATYYHQNCGGTLAAGEEVWPTVHAPYLRKHEDPYCKLGGPLPWKAEFMHDQLQKGLRAQGLTIPEGWTQLEVTARGPSGRAQKLAFRSPSQPPQMISASSLRFAVGRSFGWNRIRSDLYEIESHGDSVIFNGHGAGHGVGLCQAGAEEMARQGNDYKKILEFYYPGTQLGRTAQGLAWRTSDGPLFQLKSTQPEQDAEVVTAATEALAKLQTDLGWNLDFKVQLRVFPSMETYRNTTGQPGWIAAYTRGHIISLQPLATLKEKGILESTLRHELTHLLVESRARAATPLWFREGLVLYLSEPEKNAPPLEMSPETLEKMMESPPDQESQQRAYAAARTRVARLVKQNGREVVLHWLSTGLPGGMSGPSSQH